MRITILLCLVLAACTPSGPRFSELPQQPIAQGGARIFVLREKGTYASAQTAKISVDGARLGALAQGGFLVTDVVAGHHVVAASDLWSTSTASFDIELGNTAYVEVSPNPLSPGGLPMLGGLIGYGIASATTDNSGFYTLTFLEERSAKEKLQSLALSK